MPQPRKIKSLKNKNEQTPFKFGKTQKILLLLLIFLITMHTLPMVLILFIGLLPTFTLMVIDIKNINKLIIVGCFNLAGVFVYVFNIFKNFSVDNAVFLFSDIFNMIMMLGSAAIGLLLYYEMPLLFSYLSKMATAKRIASIDARLEKMREKWGNDIVAK